MRTSRLLLVVAGVVVGCGKVGDLPPDGPPSPDSPDNPNTTTLKLNAAGKVDLVAYQDGDGAWKVLEVNGGVYSATLAGERFGLLAACLGPGSADGSVDLKYATISDGTTWYHPGCGAVATPPTGTLQGTLAGGGADVVRIAYDFAFDDQPPSSTGYTITTFPAGSKKVIAEHLVDKVAVKLVVADVAVTAGGTTTANFDFATGFAPITRNIASDPNIKSLTITYRDAKNFITIDRAQPPFATYRAFPSNQLGTGLSRMSATESQGTTSQFTIKYFKEPVDQTVPFLAPLNLVDPPTASKAPYPVVEVHIPKRDDASYYDMTVASSGPLTDPPSFPARSWFVMVTKDWAAKLPGGTPLADVRIQMPDFTALTGWSPNFELPAATAIGWTADVTKSTVPLPGARPIDEFVFVDGSLTQAAQATGELAAP